MCDKSSLRSKAEYSCTDDTVDSLRLNLGAGVYLISTPAGENCDTAELAKDIGVLNLNDETGNWNETEGKDIADVIEINDNGTIMKNTPRRMNKRRVQRHRMKFKINDILKNVVETERNEILDCIRESVFTRALEEEIWRLIRNARRSQKSKVEASQFILRLFEADFKELSFRQWFIKKFNLLGNEELEDLLHPHLFSGSRRLHPQHVRQDVYNFWKRNAKVTTCRSNDRHIVNIVQTSINIQTIDLDDEEIQPSTDHPNQMQAHRRFTSKTYDDLFKMYELSSQYNISPSSFVALKPFYIGPVTSNEMKSCVCINCINPHNI